MQHTAVFHDLMTETSWDSVAIISFAYCRCGIGLTCVFSNMTGDNDLPAILTSAAKLLNKGAIR